MKENVKNGRKSTILKAVKFAAAMLPFAAVGGYFTGKYVYASYTEEMQQMIISQMGSGQILAIVSMVQSMMYAFICAGIGYFLADKIGLMKSLKYEKSNFKKALVIALICGVILAMDYCLFGKILPEVAKLYESGLLVYNFDNWMCSIFYGGVVEELMMRLFFMSLIAWMIWKCFFRKYTKEEIPAGVFVAANIISALAFAAGHLPATVSMFGGLTLLIVFRCFLLNGIVGLMFGWLYRKMGIQYAFIGHAGAHIISKTIIIIMLLVG